MLAITKAHYTFSGENFYKGSAGWTETYFMQVPDYNTATTNLSSLVNSRLQLLCPDVSFIGATVSDTLIKGDSFPSGLPVKVGTYVGTGSVTTYQPDMALRVLFKAGVSKRGNRWLHCLPEDQINASGQYVSTSGFATMLGNHLTTVSTFAVMGTKIKGATQPPFYGGSPYTGYTVIALDGRKIGRPFTLRRGRVLIA